MSEPKEVIVRLNELQARAMILLIEEKARSLQKEMEREPKRDTQDRFLARTTAYRWIHDRLQIALREARR